MRFLLSYSRASRLLGAAEGYHHVLTKKVACEPLEDSDKLLPIDALGIVMITHGEEFPHDSDFGGFQSQRVMRNTTELFLCPQEHRWSSLAVHTAKLQLCKKRML